MADKDKEAYWKGYNDEKRYEESDQNPISELITPSYNPPRGHEEAYRAGWDRAKKEK